ncbi:DUF1292 domain-containing protein [Paenibacillaceae bacterium WGS1546]|uniref:DUF1292 domain-containing protein n=1 Tax=Cohnella sp. WGS1546 TaxID=3366810 RepID=UPI00372D3796
MAGERMDGSSGVPGLRERFGESVELSAEDGSEKAYRIVAELTVNGQRYAVLQSEEMRQEDEIEVFRIVADSDGEPQLETVADDDDWELVAEAYDDSRFGSDDRP